MATLCRFAVRLTAIAGFALLWPHHPLASGVATLSILMAVACVASAIVGREPLHGSGLSRWDEAAALIGVVLLVHLIL